MRKRSSVSSVEAVVALPSNEIDTSELPKQQLLKSQRQTKWRRRKCTVNLGMAIDSLEDLLAERGVYAFRLTLKGILDEIPIEGDALDVTDLQKWANDVEPLTPAQVGGKLLIDSFKQIGFWASFIFLCGKIAVFLQKFEVIPSTILAWQMILISIFVGVSLVLKQVYKRTVYAFSAFETRIQILRAAVFPSEDSLGNTSAQLKVKDESRIELEELQKFFESKNIMLTPEELKEIVRDATRCAPPQPQKNVSKWNTVKNNIPTIRNNLFSKLTFHMNFGRVVPLSMAMLSSYLSDRERRVWGWGKGQGYRYVLLKLLCNLSAVFMASWGVGCIIFMIATFLDTEKNKVAIKILKNFGSIFFTMGYAGYLGITLKDIRRKFLQIQTGKAALQTWASSIQTIQNSTRQTLAQFATDVSQEDSDIKDVRLIILKFGTKPVSDKVIRCIIQDIQTQYKSAPMSDIHDVAKKALTLKAKLLSHDNLENDYVSDYSDLLKYMRTMKRPSKTEEHCFILKNAFVSIPAGSLFCGLLGASIGLVQSFNTGENPDASKIGGCLTVLSGVVPMYFYFKYARRDLRIVENVKLNLKWGLQTKKMRRFTQV